MPEVLRAGTSWIEKNPGVIGGDACVRKTRIAVWMLVAARQLGFSDEELRNRYVVPLTQADLDAAWAYYEANREEIDQAIRENEEA
ncbi:MAG: DUF433 domain-containing protein [Phycisphaerales bacterium]|nr:DUF433 domain-containing protein [Phycisphaerales bacterium]